MPHFKDTQNNIHFLDDASFIYRLPSDCVEITAAEAAALLQPTPAEIAAARKAEILTLLQGLDLKSVRPLREGDAARVAQLEQQAQALRVELAAIA